jgi:hypothetical protein
VIGWTTRRGYAAAGPGATASQRLAIPLAAEAKTVFCASLIEHG